MSNFTRSITYTSSLVFLDIVLLGNGATMKKKVKNNRNNKKLPFLAENIKSVVQTEKLII